MRSARADAVAGRPATLTTVFTKTLATTVATLSAYLTSVLLAPLMLSRLGLEAFGVWAVTGALAQYASLLDMGVSRVMSRFIAIHHAQDDERAIAECFGLGLLMVCGTVLLSAGAAFLAAPHVAEGLGVLSAADMRVVMLASVAIFGWQALRGVTSAVANGMQEFVPPAVAAVVGNLFTFVVSAVVLLVSPSLVDFATWSAISGAGGFLASVAAMVYVWRRPRLALPSGARARELFSFSMKSQLHFLADLVSNQSGKLVVAFAIDARAAAVYEIAARSVSVIKTFAFLSSKALGPSAAARIAVQGREFLEEFFLRYTRLTLAVSVPLFMVTCLTAPFLLTSWLGDVPSVTAAFLIVLSLGNLPALVREMGIVSAMADGNANLIARNALVWAGLNVGLTLMLTPLLGMWGAVLAATLALAISSATFMRRFLRIYDLSATAFWTAVRMPMALSIGVAVALAPLTVAGVGAGLADTRETAVPALFLIGALYLLAYWIPASRLRLLPVRLTLGGSNAAQRRRRVPTT